MKNDTLKDALGRSCAWRWTGEKFERTEGVPVTDRGFRYGMSVFESFPVREGVGIFLKEHLERLKEACSITGLSVPDGALGKCGEVLKEAGDGFGRIYVTAGDGAVTTDCDKGRVLIFVESRQPIGGGTYNRGYDLGLHPAGHVPVFGGVKTGNYWGNLRAFREGVAARCNETLLFTPAGHLISACMANVFIVIDGCVKTPDLSAGARAGVMREWVMRRLKVKETLITRADVEGAQEIFLTSSWLGVMPVAFLEQRPLTEWNVSLPLLAAYRRDIELK